MTISGFSFEEQVRYFEKKLNLPTNSYLDVLGKEHDYFFMVAGANRNEVLIALREAVDEAIEKGLTLDEFRQRFDGVAANTGWQYNGGRNWRTRIIYDTNVYAAYNRGRLKQHLDLADVMPYWEYQHNMNEHPRQEHMDWDGLVLPASDPWWRYHYPIKAYGCHCSVIAHDEDDLKDLGKTVGTAPEIEWEDKTVGVRSGNPRTVRIPKGYNVGFEPYNFADLNAGRNQSVDKLLMQKMTAAEPKLASLLIGDVLKNPAAMAMLNRSFAQTVEKIAITKRAAGEFNYVGVIPQAVIDTLEAKAIAPQSAVIAMRGEDILHALRDSKSGNGIGLPVGFWRELPSHLRGPTAILLDTSQKQHALIFVYKQDSGKVLVKMDYEIKLKDADTKKKTKALVNIVRTGGVITETEGLKQYEILYGEL
ncbi:phage head morphogenesis protein [Chelonobacter oris]|uniref:phage head morphogenesis protein n=1 Tax=Chelonobacter oris TaxID=505317 RepID=UPI002447F861|nr:phage minor head protein [Chelonobacter oris]MDH3001472.1 phage head morphogenesis protein [Chelonobacter oris]